MIKKLGKYISPIFYILLLYFLISYTRTLDLDTLAKVELNYYAILFASVIALVSRYIGAYTWIAILKSLGSPVREYRQLFYVYSKSWLGRYIPGKVAWIMGRIHFAAQQGIDKSSLALSTFLESGLQISVVLAMSLLIISIGSNSKVIDANLKLALLAPTLAILLFLTPPVFNRVFNFIYRKIKKSDLQVKISPRSIRIGVSFYILNFFTSGLAYFMITKAVYPQINITEILYIVGAFNLAGAVGILAFFAPSGLGVREGMLVMLLAPLVPGEIALLVAALSRIWSTIVDVLFFLITKLLNR